MTAHYPHDDRPETRVAGPAVTRATVGIARNPVFKRAGVKGEAA